MVPFRVGIGGGAGSEVGGAAKGAADDLVDVLEGCGSDGGGGCGEGGPFFFDGKGCSGRGEREGHVGSEEHMIGLDGGADEEAGKGDGRETKAARKILPRESLCRRRISFGMTGFRWKGR